MANAPFIKREEDFLNDPNRFMSATQTYGSSQNNFNNQYNNQNMNSINPAEISMQNGGYNMQNTFGSQQNLSSSFGGGGSGFNDDELLSSLTNDSNHAGGMDDFSFNMPQNNSSNFGHPSGIAMSQSGQMQNMYSNTPDGPPIQSPFLGNFDYSQFKFNSIPHHMSPHQGSHLHHKRPSIQALNRKSSEQRSPMTPKTAALAGLQIGTPEPGSYPNGRPIRTPSLQNRHAKTLSGHYDSTPGSLHSFLESPMSSPANASHHTGIGETLGMGKHSSMPVKSELDNQNQSAESVEAKKRRRRASHNAVERRRRDNINERIQDLSHLVPQHRLDDDKVKKQLQSNTPMSPSLNAVSMSPPNTANAATSLLAGASGRRAASTAGNITIGLPLDDKEKGPNKGDILNGSVSFMRDLMWALHQKYLQEDDLAERFAQLGGVWPYERSEDEKRMRSELIEAMERNDPTSFTYSRTHGSGLRVPGHTNVTGDPVPSNSNMSPQSLLELSPGFHSGGSGTNSGSGGPGQPQFWNSAGHPGISFKEEDEFMGEDDM